MHAHSSLVRRYACLLLVALCVTFASCGDDPTRPPDESFSITVTVQESDGAPVPDLDVVVWNISRDLMGYLQDDFFARRAVTSVRFELADAGRCWATVTDVAGRVLQTVYDGTELPMGSHQVRIGPEIEFVAGVELLRFELVVRDPQTDVERFRDARWMTMVEVDRQRLMLPRTDADGRVVLRDPRYVPGLVVTELMTATDESGQETGHFAIGDSVVVRAYDALGHWVQAWTAVDGGANTIEMEWVVPALAEDSAPEFASIDGSGEASSMADPAKVPLPDPSDALYQNAPNPFN